MRRGYRRALIGVLVLSGAAVAWGAPLDSPRTLLDGATSCTASAGVITTIGAGYAIRLQNNDTAETILYGDASPVLKLRPLDETSFNVSDLTTLYCQRGGSTDVTVTWAVLIP